MLLKYIKPTFDFSFIITTRNNIGELIETLNSISSEVPKNSEIIIVDGSDKPLGKQKILDLLKSDEVSVTYVLDNKKGVYAAMNVGVENSNGLWIVMITAGDYLLKGGCKLLDNIKYSEKEAVVFSQDIIDQSRKLAYTHEPTVKSIWPHQSVILKRSVHEKLGLYPIEYPFLAEQYLFIELRNKLTYEIRKERLTAFCLGGITSGASLKNSWNTYEVRRKLGTNVFSAFVQAYIFTFVRNFLEGSKLLRPLSMKIRKTFFAYYIKPKGN